MNDAFDFARATRHLLYLMQQQLLSLHVSWVFADDLSWADQKLHVHWPLPAQNEEVIRSLVEGPVAQTIGVELRAIGRTQGEILCGLELPADEREAELLMIHGLKVSIPIRLIDASRVTNQTAWAITKLKHTEPSPFDGICGRAADPLYRKRTASP